MYDIDPANVRLRELQTFPSYKAQLNHLECELEEMYRGKYESSELCMNTILVCIYESHVRKLYMQQHIASSYIAHHIIA